MKMRKMMAAAALSALVLTGCTAVQTDVPTGMARASNEIVDYDLFVPDEWTIDLTGGAVSAVKSTSDPFNVSMMVWNLPYADTNLADWWETYQAEFTMIFDDFAMESTETTTLDGVAAEKYVYTATLGEVGYRYTQIAAIRRGSVYLMTFTELADSSDDTVETHQSEISEIVQYFRWR